MNKQGNIKQHDIGFMERFFSIKAKKNYPEDLGKEHTSEIIFYKRWKMLDNISLTLLMKV